MVAFGSSSRTTSWAKVWGFSDWAMASRRVKRRSEGLPMLLNELAIGAKAGDTRSSAVTEGLEPALATAFKPAPDPAFGLDFNLAFDWFALIR
jgi:hypothetical protein